MTKQLDLYRYNALDAACTLQAKEAFWPDLADGFLPAYDMTLDLFPVLTYMMTRGIAVDMEALKLTRDDILQQAATKQEELNQLVGRELNVNSTQQCQAYFYAELGIDPYIENGRITVNDLALQRLARGTAKRPGLRQARLVQDIRGLQKLHGTYLNIEFDTDSRMRCSYNPRGTKFGRLSSSKTLFGTGTNMQNLPQEFKRFLVADPGYILWEIDKRQAEWVVVAYVSGDANMIKAVEEGLDIHVHTASLIFNVSHEIVQRESKMVGMTSDSNSIEIIRGADEILSQHCRNFPRTMSARQCGKKSNHAFNYDEGPHKWSLMNEVEIAEGKRIHAMYHTGYPGIRIWYEAIKRQLQRDNRVLANCFGRRVRFMGAWDDDLFKAAYSFIPQSTVVDSLNQGLVKIYNDDSLCSPSGANIDVLAQVHDSVLMQVPIHLVRNVMRFQEIQRIIYSYVEPTLEYNQRQFTIATDSKFGFNWAGRSQNNTFGMRETKDHNETLTLLDEYERAQTH